MDGILGNPAPPPLDHGTCLSARNFGNAQYTVTLAAGTPPQLFNVVPDTGSFELLLPRADCDGCEGHNLFTQTKSVSYKESSPLHEGTTSYGQGSVVNDLASDVVGLGDLKAPHQDLLLMRKTELRGYDMASYDGIMGMGLLDTAGDDPTDPSAPTYPSLFTSMGVKSWGVCFGQGDGTKGRIDLSGNPPPGLNPPPAGLPPPTTLPVIGKHTWSVKLGKVGVGGLPHEAGSCGKTGCVALVDSGTSLIALPSDVLTALKPLLDMVAEDCSNFHTLPPLTFELNGNSLWIPSHLWIIQMEASSKMAEVQVGPFKLPLLSQSAKLCTPALMASDMQTLSGPMAILGMPFLRAYASVFSRPAKTITLHPVPEGSNVCDGCTPSARSSFVSSDNFKSLLPKADNAAFESAINAPTKLAPARVDRTKLRFPAWAMQYNSSSRFFVL